MKEWFNNLEQRERQLLTGGAIILLLLMVYVLGIEPFMARYASMQASASQNEKLVAWMRERADEVKQLRAALPSQGRSQIGQSILGSVDKTAKSMGLSDSVKRVQPEGSSKARVHLEGAQFDRVVSWLENLQRQQGIEIVSSAIEKKSVSGLVDVRLVLEGNE